MSSRCLVPLVTLLTVAGLVLDSVPAAGQGMVAFVDRASDTRRPA